MKTINSLICLTFLLFSANSFALDGTYLSSASNSAFDEYSVEFGVEGVKAWETLTVGNEIEVKILSHDHDTELESVVAYGCHLHGASMVCHEEGHEGEHVSLKSEENGFDFVMSAHKAALAKLEKTLIRRGSSLASLSLVKVWKLAEEDDHKDDGHDDHDDNDSDGHDHGADVWTKVIYTLDGQEKTTFIQCHQHAGEKDFACHYKKEGQGEPEIKTDGDHDHAH